MKFNGRRWLFFILTVMASIGVVATISITLATIPQPAFATLLEQTEPGLQGQQTDELINQERIGKNLQLPNSSEVDRNKIDILEETSAGTIANLSGDNESEVILGKGLCPPFCSIPKPPPPIDFPPPNESQSDTTGQAGGQKVTNPLLDVVYRDGEVTRSDSSESSGKVASTKCLDTELLIGGGWKSDNPNVLVQSTYAEKNEWLVQFHSSDGPVQLRAFALCLKFNAK